MKPGGAVKHGGLAEVCATNRYSAVSTLVAVLVMMVRRFYMVH